MNKKIASELAIGIILLLVIIFTGIFLVQNRRQEQEVISNVPVKLDEKKDVADPASNVADSAQAENQTQDLTAGFEKDPCAGHLYEGEVQLRGRYVLDSTYGNIKEWLFKILDEDKAKLPVQVKYGDGRDVNDLLKIEDATPELVAKLKTATEENPQTISIKGYYLYCEGGPIVSIQPPKLALAKYFKK